jgi:hypothetical protein
MNLYVKLEGSDNTYLTYPCFGLLHILEVGTTGSIIVATFRVAQNGILSAPVRVQNATFSYSSDAANEGHAAVVELMLRQGVKLGEYAQS